MLLKEKAWFSFFNGFKAVFRFLCGVGAAKVCGAILNLVKRRFGVLEGVSLARMGGPAARRAAKRRLTCHRDTYQTGIMQS